MRKIMKDYLRSVPTDILMEELKQRSSKIKEILKDFGCNTTDELHRNEEFIVLIRKHLRFVLGFYIGWKPLHSNHIGDIAVVTSESYIVFEYVDKENLKVINEGKFYYYGKEDNKEEESEE